jgi:uncharacterized protein (TIGR00375 family)
MCVREISRFGKLKGLGIVGTGDFTHPKWFEELGEALVPEPGTGLYRLGSDGASNVRFMVTSEVCTVFAVKSGIKKVHHVILTPSFETAAQINDRLSNYGSLSSDGRPTLDLTAAHLVEEIMEVSDDNMVFPAHAWTPWFSIFGAFSGFDSVEECYEDMAKHVYSLETGLSSDPPMNWRLSRLDEYTLVSNSDCHSFWPWRIGREANVFDLSRPDYYEVLRAIRSKDAARFKFTIETDPSYGKYHWTGHRNCNVSLSPADAAKLGNICPVCRRRLTKGVEQRVEELADRPEGFKPEKAIGFMRLLPLSEIIATVLGVDSPSAERVWSVYTALVEKFGNEYSVLIDRSGDELSSVVDKQVAEAILRVREGRVRVVPGYDGVYGQLILNEEMQRQAVPRRAQQLNLTDFVF